jgi:16S rRNA (guanine966-N2)-methyltransferase
MRIVAGKLAGRDLASPQDRRVRPTAEHVRVAMIDMVHDDLKDARVLELFAGTGAIGLEALSRGARSVDFVEFRPDSLHALRANIAALRLRESTRIFKRDAIPYAAMLGPSSYDIAFADPPYDLGLASAVAERWLAVPFAQVLGIEHRRAERLPGDGDRRQYGQTAITFFRRP